MKIIMRSDDPDDKITHKNDEVIEHYKYTSKGWKLIRTLVPSRVRRKIKRVNRLKEGICSIM